MNIIGANGSIQRLPGWPNEPLNSTMNRHVIADFHANCNGGDILRRYSDDVVAENYTHAPYCGKCHIVVSEPWYTYMKPRVHPVELDTLEKTNQNVFPNSRLACCIALKPWMNDMIIRIHYESHLHTFEDNNDIIDTSIGGSNPFKTL